MNSDLLTSDIELINQKVKFSCRTRENVPVTVDYTPPIGDDEGYTSLELLLISLSSCIGTSLAVTLRRMKKNLLDLSIKSRGYRREEHPTSFRRIELDIKIDSPDIVNGDVDKALALSEKICPVWCMLKGNVEIRTSFCINEVVQAVK